MSIHVKTLTQKNGLVPKFYYYLIINTKGNSLVNLVIHTMQPREPTGQYKCNSMTPVLAPPRGDSAFKEIKGQVKICQLVKGNQVQGKY
jgi:hypothetical protein